jgi:hypothetical protein
MAVLTNNWTQQVPLSAVGATGIQSIRFIPACRVFLKTPDSKTAAPVNQMAAYSMKTNGITPTGWTDTGIMDAPGKITYTKNKKKIQTGIDKVTRATYIESREASVSFDLTQIDDVVMTALGFVNSVITAGSTVNFQLGQEDVIQKAMLMVYANKLDGKEIQWYHPSAEIDVDIDMSSDAVVAKCNADLVAFIAAGGYTVSSLLSATIFA